MKTLASPLLDLLDQRWNELLKDVPDPTGEKPFKRPVFDPGRGAALIDGAARHHAEAWASDPFAWGRTRHYMRQGYETPSEVEKDAHGILIARKRGGATFAAVMT